MREIKFRAWDKVANFFLKWEDFIGYENDQIPIAGDDYRVFNDNEFIIEQSTGLTDKNGKEIYEGDIIRSAIKPYFTPKIIEYSNFYGSFVKFNSDHDRELEPDGHRISQNWLDELGMNIIGNIHENPELLERGK